ncbi:hypothetical protein [uncultured Sphingobacterium sp.]|nr:hypothetical protein [uncultured Sphingobacterium sp.]
MAKLQTLERGNPTATPDAIFSVLDEIIPLITCRKEYGDKTKG